MKEIPFRHLERNRSDLYGLYCSPKFRTIAFQLIRLWISFDIYDAYRAGDISAEKRDRLLSSRDQFVIVKTREWLEDDKRGLIYQEERN